MTVSWWRVAVVAAPKGMAAQVADLPVGKVLR
jgi:hypothetical protein